MKGALYTRVSTKEQTAGSDTQIGTFGESSLHIEKMLNEHQRSLRFLAWLTQMEIENPVTLESGFHKSQIGTGQVILYGHSLD
jgi:predicted site-specific integrase-resolvase